MKAVTAPPTTLDKLVDAAKVLHEQRMHLSSMVTSLQAGINALKTDALPEIRDAIRGATAAWQALEQLIQQHPALFVSPRTVEAHGIKFGLQKGKGGLDIPNPQRTVELIERNFPELVDQLIVTDKTPSKTGLATLAAKELKVVGVGVKNVTDVVFIRPADGDVDKLVKALVSAVVEEAKPCKQGGLA